MSDVVMRIPNEENPQDNSLEARRFIIESSIDDALASRQVEVWYQPQIDYTYGMVIGAEALARWKHPELGWINPAEFIPVLERCGKIHALDLFVWEEACRSASRWRNLSDGKPIPISVNVSRAEMFEESLLDHFLELQKRYDLPDGSLHLEITESAFVKEADQIYCVIEDIRKNKFSVEMDDFGGGLSSLSMLKDIPIDVVKLDIGFIRSTIDEDRGGVVLSSVIRMLQGLNTPIIAEGVETLQQAEMLKNMGCHLMQGYHFSRPMPLDDFEAFIASSNTAQETDADVKKKEVRLDELTSANAASSYLFNHAMGPTLFFFAGEGTSESILVNDAFYEACGIPREAFGDTKIDPIQEIDPESRATLWRAAAEARESSSAFCRGVVRITGVWIDCVMRYLGTSTRGDVYSLNIVKSGKLSDEEESMRFQLSQDGLWTMDMLSKISDGGFLKCQVNDDLSIDFMSPSFMRHAGLSEDEFMRRFHNSFAAYVSAEDRDELVAAIIESARSEEMIELDFNANYGYFKTIGMKMIGRVDHDAQKIPWLYALVMPQGKAKTLAGQNAHMNVLIPLDYYLKEDKLVIHPASNDPAGQPIVRSGILDMLESMPNIIPQASAAKILASIKDIEHHPVAGFIDIKSNMRGGNALRWYHIDYVCETDEDGNTAIIHGYAQDANDQIGSTKWWRRQAETDHLTGLLNRSMSEQQINLGIRTQGAGMMFMIDLDGFKRVNDELGHLVGDALLRDVAHVLSEQFRENDVLGRYGGDEFVAFIAFGEQDPHVIAERLSKSIIEKVKSIDVPDGTHVGCSIGVAICRQKHTSFYDLLEAADKAMYTSKEAGKGRFTIVDM